MAEQITYEKALEMMSKHENSQLMAETKQQHMKLLPKHIGNAKLGVSEQLKASLSLYSKRLDGVPIAFKNVKSLQRLGQILGDQACIHFDIVADFVIFKPSIGCTLRGVIHKIGNQHFGCLVHQCFNAWFPLENSGLDASPDLIGSEVEFKVIDIHTNNNVMSLKGEFIQFTEARPPAASLSLTNLTKKGTHTDLSQSVDDTMETPASSQMEPLFSSTMMETPLKKKRKKSKKKMENLDMSGINLTANISTEKINNSLKENSMVSVNGECDSVLDDSSGKKKKKKKMRKRKSGAMNSNETDNVTATSLESTVETETKEQLMQVGNISKSRKRKAKHVEERLVGDEDGEIAEIMSPRKKTKNHKDKATVAELKQFDSSQDFQDNVSLSTHNNSKKKRKKEKK